MLISNKLVFDRLPIINVSSQCLVNKMGLRSICKPITFGNASNYKQSDHCGHYGHEVEYSWGKTPGNQVRALTRNVIYVGRKGN